MFFLLFFRKYSLFIIKDGMIYVLFFIVGIIIIIYFRYVFYVKYNK